MNNEILILTLLPEKGTTGVQSHFNSFADYLTENNINNKILTPYTYGLSFYERLLRKLILNIVKKIDNERSIILIRELLIRSLRNNLLKYVKNNSKLYYIYAQEPSIALMASDLKNDFKDFNFMRINLICHFNISEIYEYMLSHNVNENGLLGQYLMKKEKNAFINVDKIIFPSLFLKNHVKNRNGSIATIANASVIHNFTKNDEFQKDTNYSEVDFISIGTLEPRKNQEFLLRIISELHKLGYKKKLMIVGDGPDRKKLEELANHLNINNYVIFTGYVENAKKLIKNAKFLLHVPKMENFGIVLLEALSCGIPVCATSVGGIPEIYTDNSEGVFLDLNNAKKSAEKIIPMFEPHTYLHMSENAKRRYNNEFTSFGVCPVLTDTILGVKK